MLSALPLLLSLPTASITLPKHSIPCSHVIFLFLLIRSSVVNVSDVLPSPVEVPANVYSTPQLQQMSKQEGLLLCPPGLCRVLQLVTALPSKQSACCRFRCGRKRNGTLMQADIADALIARGNVARAAIVLQRQARLFMREGWWDLAAAVLQRLLHCQKLLMQVSLWRCYTSSITHAPCIVDISLSHDSALTALLRTPHDSDLTAQLMTPHDSDLIAPLIAAHDLVLAALLIAPHDLALSALSMTPHKSVLAALLMALHDLCKCQRQPQHKLASGRCASYHLPAAVTWQGAVTGETDTR